MSFLTAEELHRWERMLRLIRHMFEFLVTLIALGIFKVLSIDTASELGSRIGRFIGPLVPTTKRARLNLTSAFPEKSSKEIETIVRDMWSNLGRLAAEYAHFSKLR